ncbi:MAG: helix-turn-helix domain-containing protein [Pseudomonadota bacterium]
MPPSKEKLIRSCSIWRALELLGDKPTLLLLESYWVGTRRFADFCRDTGLLKTVVSNRLQKLVEAECLKKVEYSAKPLRYEYHGTEKLHSVYPTALSMLFWERKWNKQSNKLALELRHRQCGAVTSPIPICGECASPIDAREVEWQEGPGVGQMAAHYSRRRKSRSARQEQKTTQLFDTLAGILGDRSSMLIIRALFTGHSSFGDIQADSQLATNMLTERLGFLIEEKILQKISHKNGLRQRYKLTPRGLDLYPTLLTLMAWGDQWCADENGPPVLLKHNTCGHGLNLVMDCSACKEAVNYTDIEFTVRQPSAA